MFEIEAEYPQERRAEEAFADLAAIHAALGSLATREAREAFLLEQIESLQNRNRVLQETGRLQEQAAYTDPLTKLLNRGGLERYVDTVNGLPKVLFGLDLTGFKGINDRFGHLVGDKVLQGVGRIISSNIRSNDGAARPGGDEFVVILLSDQPDEIIKVWPERLQEEVNDARHGVQMLLGEPVHLSIGATVWAAGEPYETAYQRADKALYEQKAEQHARLGIAPR